MFIPDQIKEARRIRKISGESLVRQLLADGLNITRQTLFNWETGRSFPNAKHLEHLSIVLNVPVSSFFTPKMKRSASLGSVGRFGEVRASKGQKNAIKGQN